MKLQKDGKEVYFLSNDELIALYDMYSLKLSSSDISNRNISSSEFDLGLYGYLFEENAFWEAFQSRPSQKEIPNMFFLLSVGYIDLKKLPEIYNTSVSIDKDTSNRCCLNFLKLYNLYQLSCQEKVTPEIIATYNKIFKDDDERINYEKAQLESFSMLGEHLALNIAFSLLENNLFMAESLDEYVNPENASIIIESYNLSASAITKLYNAGLLHLDTVSTTLTMQEIIEQYNSGNLQFNPETDHLNLETLDRDSVYMAHANGLVMNSDISSYIEKDTDIPPTEYLVNLYTNQLVDLNVLEESFSEDELLEMHVNGIIGTEIIGALSETTTEDALHAKKISQETVFDAYVTDIIDLETLVSHQPEEFKLSRFVTSKTPSSKIEEMFLNNCLSYSELKQLQEHGIISSAEKADIVSRYDITPDIKAFSQRASIKYNNYKPEHSIDPEELLITLGAEGIIPVTDDFNLAYIPSHKVGILYETTNFSNYIGTSNKTYVMDLLDAIEVVKNNTYGYLPENHPYISATANYGTELLDSIHSIDKSFEYKTSDPEIADYISDIKVQFLGNDRED